MDTVLVAAETGEEAAEIARKVFTDTGLYAIPSTVTAEEITMKFRTNDIANKEEWNREADEEAWQAEAAAATARRQKSNGKG